MATNRHNNYDHKNCIISHRSRFGNPRKVKLSQRGRIKRSANSQMIENNKDSAKSKTTRYSSLLKSLQKNVGVISLAFTALIAIGSVVIKLIYYFWNYGYTMHFNIPKSYIDVSKDNLLYSFIADGIMALFVVLLNLIPYFLWKKNRALLVKIICSLLIVILFPNIILIVIIINDLHNGIEYSVSNIFLLLFIGFLYGVMIFVFGFIFGIDEHISNAKKNKKKKKDKKKKKVKEHKELTNSQKLFKAIVCIAVLLVIESFLCIFAGFENASSKNEFRIIQNPDQTTYAVIYETSDSYIITRCTISDKTITFVNVNTQQEINKSDVEYSIVRLDQKDT